MNTHRSRTKIPEKRNPPTHIAIAVNQVWTWDITWLNASIKGQYYKLYLIVDMFSRFIVGYEVWETEKNDNPYSESLFKTMKYRPKYPFKGFGSLEEARKWVQKFVKWYNYSHLHSGINFLTPYQRHYGLDKEIIKKRQETYEKARAKNPERWSKSIRDWSLPEYVSLNPIKEEELKKYVNE